MAYKLATAYVDIQARTGGLHGQLQGVQGMLGNLFSMFRNINPILAAATGIGALTYATSQFIPAAIEAYDAQARLEAVIRATGGAAGFTADEILNLSSLMQSKTTFGDEAITDAASKLLTFKSITGDTFKETLALATDLSATGFGGLQGSVLQLGKALEDPIRGLGALRRSGVSFTEAQKAQIKSLVESNHLLKAQKIILEAVRGQVGGVAEAMAKTPAGQWKQIQNTLGDIGEEIGKRILPYAIQLSKIGLRVAEAILYVFDRAVAVDKALGGWPSKVAVTIVLLSQVPAILGVIESSMHAIIRLSITDELATWALAFKRIPAQLAGIKGGFQSLYVATRRWWFGAMVPAMGGMIQVPGMLAKIGTAWKALSVAIATGTLFTGWGIIIVAIGAIVAGLVTIGIYVSRFEKVQLAWARTWEALRLSVNEIWMAVSELVNALIANEPILMAIIDGMAGGFGIVKTLLRDGLPAAAKQMADTLTTTLLTITAAVLTLKTHLKDVAKLMLDISNRNLVGIAITLRQLNTAIPQTFGKEYGRLKAELDKRIAAMKATSGTSAADPGGATAPSLDINSGLIGLQDAWRTVQEALLKKDNPAERTADGVEGIEETSRKLLEEAVKTNTTLAGAKLAIV